MCTLYFNIVITLHSSQKLSPLSISHLSIAFSASHNVNNRTNICKTGCDLNIYLYIYIYIVCFDYTQSVRICI